MSINKGNIIQLASIKDGIDIGELSIYKGRAIEKVGGDSNEVDNIGIVDANKIIKSKDLVKVRVSFLTPEARLAFTKLRQVFIKVPILYYFDSECHI